MKNYKVVLDKNLSKRGDNRYVVVDANTGEVLDDAQGYGYKSAQNAHAAYGYKTRDKSKDGARKEKEQKIRDWMKHHKGFVRSMDEYAFEIVKGSWGPDDEFNAAFVREMLEDARVDNSRHRFSISMRCK